MRGRILEWEGITLATVARHSVGHRNPPHMVNYRALALGCKGIGVKACLASAAVGSLRPDWNTGTLAICGDSIDMSARNITMYENEIRHTDVTRIFPLHDCMSQAANELWLDVRTMLATYAPTGHALRPPLKSR